MNGDGSHSPGGQRHPGPAAFTPTFVVGCERSGTTLLAVLIGRHSQIAMTPETHFFLRTVPKRHPDREGDHAEMVDRFFNSPRAGDLGISRPDVLARFAAGPATYDHLFQILLESYASRVGKPRVGEKTPFHLLRVPLILKWFPDARIVAIVRDGRDVVLSIRNAPWTAYQSLRRHCWRWTECAQIAYWHRRQHPDRFYIVRYEDLVCDTEATLRGVDQFLGVPFEAGQLDPARPSHVVPMHERGWKANATERPDPARVGAWMGNIMPEERLVMNSMMGDYLRKFGYGDTDMPPVSRVKRVRNRMKNSFCRAGVYRLWYNIFGRYTPAARAFRRRGGERKGAAAASEIPEESSDATGEAAELRGAVIESTA